MTTSERMRNFERNGRISGGGFARLGAAVSALAVGLLIATTPDLSYGDAPAKASKKAAPAALSGATYDYDYDASDIKQPTRAWLGRAYVHPQVAAEKDKPRPILVFIHGLNTELIKYRWMGGGREGDVRQIASEMMDAGDIPPMIVAAPSSIVPAAVVVARTSWPAFDLDRFLDLTEARLAGIATIDRSRVIVAGHSGGGCNESGGLASAVQAKTPLLAAMSIDTCMDPAVAGVLGAARPSTHVIVSWQTMSWAKRPFSAFRARFLKEGEAKPAASGVYRTLEEVHPREPMPHDAMVGFALRRWLPKLLAEGGSCDPQMSSEEAPACVHGGGISM